MDATAETMGPRDFSRLLADRFKLRMSHQAVSKANYLPKVGGGRIIVQDALVLLADRGRIKLDVQEDLPLDAADLTEDTDNPVEAKTGRPQQAGGLAYEQTLTERVKRRKLEMELAEKEGRLLPVQDVTDAMVAAGRRIGEAFDQLPTLADELVAAARGSGAQGVRDVLRRQVRLMRQQLADALTLDASGEEEDDPA